MMLNIGTQLLAYSHKELSLVPEGNKTMGDRAFRIIFYNQWFDVILSSLPDIHNFMFTCTNIRGHLYSNTYIF